MRIDASTRGENGYNQTSEPSADNSSAGLNPTRNPGPIELQMLRNLPKLTSEVRIREQPDSAVGSQRRDSVPSGSGMNTESAAGALGTYMRENGLEKVNMNDLYQLAENASGRVPPHVQQAAKYMLQHRDLYKQIETHDLAAAGGISNRSNFEWAAQGGLGSTGGQMTNGDMSTQPANGPQRDNDVNAQATPGVGNVGTQPTNSPQQVSDMNGPKAAGVMATHMHKNKLDSLNWNTVYLLAVNADGNTPPEVQQAAKYMLAHRQETVKMAALDPDSPEGYITATAFNKAVQADDSAGGSPSMASESGVLAAHMREKGIASLDVDQLIKLSTDKEASPRARQAAKYMLDHPEEFRRIQTRGTDTANSSASASVEDFEWATQAGSGSAGARTNADNVNTQPDSGPQHDNGTHVQETPRAGNASPQPADGPHQANDLNGPKAAGIIATYMRKNQLDTLNWTQTANLMNNASGNVPPEVQQAAKYMWEHREETTRMAALDPESPEGYITATALNRAAQTDDSTGGSPKATSESGVLSAYMREKGLSSVNYGDLVKLSSDKEAPPRVRQAAKYMLDHPDEFKRIEARDGANPDGSANVDDFEYTSQYGLTST